MKIALLEVWGLATLPLLWEKTIKLLPSYVTKVFTVNMLANMSEMVHVGWASLPMTHGGKILLVTNNTFLMRV